MGGADPRTLLRASGGLSGRSFCAMSPGKMTRSSSAVLALDVGFKVGDEVKSAIEQTWPYGSLEEGQVGTVLGPRTDGEKGLQCKFGDMVMNMALTHVENPANAWHTRHHMKFSKDNQYYNKRLREYFDAPKRLMF